LFHLRASSVVATHLANVAMDSMLHEAELAPTSRRTLHD
jgi:hypothetical protein